MRHAGLATLALLLAIGPAYAGEESGDQQVVVVNAAQKLGSVGQIAPAR